jgi:hypothetical protein
MPQKLVASAKVELMQFFIKHQKFVDRPDLSRDEIRHLNLAELDLQMQSIETILSADVDEQDLYLIDKNRVTAQEYETWQLLINLMDGKVNFQGKLGPSLLNFFEFYKIVQESDQNGTLISRVLEMHSAREQDALQQFLKQRKLLDEINDLSFSFSEGEIEISVRPILTAHKEEVADLEKS